MKLIIHVVWIAAAQAGEAGGSQLARAFAAPVEATATVQGNSTVVQWICTNGIWSDTACWSGLNGGDLYPDNGVVGYAVTVPDGNYTVTVDPTDVTIDSLTMPDTLPEVKVVIKVVSGHSLTILETVSGPGRLWADGSVGVGSTVSLPNLATLVGPPSGTLELEAAYDGRVLLPNLTGGSGNVTFYAHHLDGGTHGIVDCGQLDHLWRGAVVRAWVGGEFIAAPLVDLSRGEVEVQTTASQIDLSHVTGMDDAAVFAAGGAIVSFPLLVSYQTNVLNYVVRTLRSKDDSQLSFPALTSINAGAGTVVQVWTYGSPGGIGGKLLLPALTTMSGTIRVWVSGALNENQKALIELGQVNLDSASTLLVGKAAPAEGMQPRVAGGELRVLGSMRYAINSPASFSFSDDDATQHSTLRMVGGTAANYVTLEVGGADLGDVPPPWSNNFQLERLIIGPGAHVRLLDQFDNSPGAGDEALYVERLRFDTAGGTNLTGHLDLNCLHLYYNVLEEGDPSQIGAPPQPIIYVNDDAAGTCDGTSWTNAFTDLQDALQAAESSGGVVEEIWVAGGIYKPTPGTDRTASFQLVNGVALIGGLAGDETRRAEFASGKWVSELGAPAPGSEISHLRSQISNPPCGLARRQNEADERNRSANETILSGDLLGDDGPNFSSNGENSYHVVVADRYVDDTAVLDGFTVIGGNANGDGDYFGVGGGMWVSDASPTVRNVRFEQNSATHAGGGMRCWPNSSPTLTNCVFFGNRAAGIGALSGAAGGMAIHAGSSPTLIGCQFVENVAIGVSSLGGGINTDDTSTATLINCTFVRNTAERGGGMLNSGNPIVMNCSFYGNSASEYGGGLANELGPPNDPSNPLLMNCVFVGNRCTNAASNGGGGMYTNGGTPVLVNCTFAANLAVRYGGAILNAAQSGGPDLANCILWGNADANGAGESSQLATIYGPPAGYVVNHCDVQGWSGAFGGVGIGSNPLFVHDPDDGNDDEWGTDDDLTNLRLADGSPAIDAGSNGAVAPDAADLDCDGNLLEPVPFDLDGAPRFVDSNGAADTGVSGNGYAEVVDMGAYEQGPLTGARLLYVNASAPPGGDGLTWTTAYDNPQDALDYALETACGALDVWVAAGTYVPTRRTDPTDPRSATFQLLDGVVFYGGLAGTEDAATFDLNTRNFTANQTVLSGSLPGDGAYHVVTATGNSDLAILDGFTITGGNAAWPAPPPHGGGLISLAGGPTLRNCIIAGNQAHCAAGLSASGIVTVDDLTIGTNNGGGDMGLSQGGLLLEGPLTVTSGAQLDIFGGAISGPSALQLDAGSLMRARNVSPCGAEIITSAGGPLDATTIFIPLDPSPPPVPAQWSITGAPVSTMFLDGVNQTWTILNATLDWSGNYLNQDVDPDGPQAEATFHGGGSLSLVGDLTGPGFYITGVLLTAEVGPFRVRETTATSNVLEFVAGQEPVLTPMGGLLTNSLGFILDGPQKLTMVFAAAQQNLDHFDSASTIALTGQSQLAWVPVNPALPSTRIHSDITGAGDIEIDVGARLTISGLDTLVDLSGQPPTSECATTDPDEWGSITIHGELVVQDATVQNTDVDVALSDIQGSTQIVNNDISLLESSADFGGQFFVDGAATIRCNLIRSFGDRFLDLDPDPTANPRPTIADNVIHVFVTQGTQSEQGELLELRAFDHNCADSNGCPSGAYPLTGGTGFDDTWTLQRLEIQPNAKVNLTNRAGFDFNLTDVPDTLYVKDLIIGSNGVLNTGLQRMYYQTLTLDPGARTEDVPLLGFSLKVIAMEDDTEFAVRVRTRVRDAVDVQPLIPPFKEGDIRRASGKGAAAMFMRTQAANFCAPNPQCSATSVAAIGAFARAGEDEIVVTFDYFFFKNPDAELIVYLKDTPEPSPTGCSTNGCCDDDRCEVARVYVPPDGRDGSIDGLGYATFYGAFPRGNLNFHRGTYVELELRGADAAVAIANWDPRIRCSGCADLNGTGGPEGEDYLLLLASFGLDIDANTRAETGQQENADCFDSVLGGDRYVDTGDLLAWDTFLDEDALNACGTGVRGEPRGLPPRSSGMAIPSEGEQGTPTKSGLSAGNREQ